jgi:plastocyanin
MRRAVVRWMVLVVSSTALAAAFVWQAGASGGGGCGRPVTDARGTSVTIKGYCFNPTVLHVRPGQAITWTNQDQAEHTVSGSNAVWGSYAGLKQGRSVTYRFVRPGAYPYVCLFHPGMVAAVVVGNGDGPGAARTTSTQKGPVVQVHPNAARLTRSDLAAGPGAWPVAAFVGFGLFAMALVGVTLQRHRHRRNA